MLATLVFLLVCIPSAAAQASAAKDSEFDTTSEQQLVQMTNQDRAQKGVAPLQFDPKLQQAARAHAQLMVEHQQLSHDFPGEPELRLRLAAAGVHSNSDAENVAFDQSAAGANDGFMHSPPRRANILNPDYNAVGIAAINRDGQLWVVEDFAHVNDDYSASQAEEIIAKSVAKLRSEARLPPLQRRTIGELQKDACAMSSKDKLQPKMLFAIPRVHHVLAYTNANPGDLPTDAVRALRSPHSDAFSVGACFARTRTYPGGTYWVALV